jgi:hypothetical protein
MTFDPKRPLVMATAKTVLGHALPIGQPLAIVDDPSKPGEVDEALARRLHASKLAGYRDELHATPVETPEQERNRLALERVREARSARDSARATAGDDAGEEVPLEVTPTDDLLVHPEGRPKAGKKVTRDDLLDIAQLEGVVIETDDNKSELTRKIMESRAQRAQLNGLNAETDGAGGQGDTAPQRTTGLLGTGRADSGADGDAHGEAGEGPSDAD